jgi:spermidine/putrescine transport system permease protein
VSIAAVAHSGAGPEPGAEPPAAPGRRRWLPYLLLLPGLAWLTVFFAVPIFTLFGTSTQTAVPGGDIGEFTQTFRVANYTEAISEYSEQFIRSFLYAGLATVLALLIGYPLAYLIALRSGRWRNILLVLVVAPFFTSFILRTIAWKQILAEEGFVVSTLKGIHLVPQDYNVTASAVAVVAGITYNFLPFMVLPLYASLERIDPRLIEAGSDLYGNGFAVLRKVTFPLSMPGVVAGTLLTFIPAAGDYVNASLLGTPRSQLIGYVF